MQDKFHLKKIAMQTYKMSRSTAVTAVFLIILGLAILITAASCCNKLQPQATVVDNPTSWDSVEYNSIDCYVNNTKTNIVYNLEIVYNKEYIEINNNEESFTVKFIGHWSNNNTFVMQNNVGIATVNLKTKYLTIRYSDFTKEIYIPK